MDSSYIEHFKGDKNCLLIIYRDHNDKLIKNEHGASYRIEIYHNYKDNAISIMRYSIVNPIKLFFFDNFDNNYQMNKINFMTFLETLTNMERRDIQFLLNHMKAKNSLHENMYKIIMHWMI